MWALIPTAFSTESGRQGVTYHSCWDKSGKTKPWRTKRGKFPFGPPLPTRTEKPSKVERDDETQQRRHRQALHHIKGNIFKKHSHTEELLRHQQRNLHRAVWVNSLSFTQPFRRTDRVAFRHAVHSQTTAQNINGTFSFLKHEYSEMTRFWNGRTVVF